MTWDGDDYQHRFDALGATGVDVHGEATFVRSLAPSSVLDAGCGTGRVAIELRRAGIEVVGADADPSMLATARRLEPAVTWVEADVVSLHLGRTFAVVLMAGNVPLFTAPGTQGALVAGCGRHVAPGGALVAGFELGRGYDLGSYDDDCTRAGLVLEQRWGTWDRDPWVEGGSYAVAVHRRAV